MRVSAGIKSAITFPLSLIDNLSATKKSQILKTIDLANISRTLPLLIYVHYSKYSLVSDRELLILRKIREAGFQVVLVINTDNREFSVTKFEGIDSVILRFNSGWDLGAYRDAFFELQSKSLVGAGPIFFMNNSVIWFPEKITNYFHKILPQDFDIISGTISRQYRDHVQTFMLGSLTPNGTRELQNWLSGIKNWRLKRTVVRMGELGTNCFFSSDLKLTSFPSSNEIIECGLAKIHEAAKNGGDHLLSPTITRLMKNRSFMMAGLPMNPSHSQWLELFEKGFPGIKVDLIRSNPLNLEDYDLAINILLESGVSYSEIVRLLSSNVSKSPLISLRSKIRW